MRGEELKSPFWDFSALLYILLKSEAQLKGSLFSNDIFRVRYFSIIALSDKVRCLLIGLLLSAQTVKNIIRYKNRFVKLNARL